VPIVRKKSIALKASIISDSNRQIYTIQHYLNVIETVFRYWSIPVPKSHQGQRTFKNELIWVTDLL